jgi:putative ABC transport system permease protein
LKYTGLHYWHIFGFFSAMFGTYLKIAYRNLVRNKIFSFINIFGLAIGLTTCLLIMTYIFSEWGYDTQNKDAGLIYRVASAAQTASGKKEKGWAATAAPVAWGLKKDLPEVAYATRLLKFPTLDKMLLTYTRGNERKQFYETNGYYVDSTFFRVFTYHFSYGDALTALEAPNSVVISEEVAKKMFGNENPVGRSINIGMPFGNFDYTVKGVFEDKTLKSHIPAHFLLSMRNGDIGTWVETQTNWATNNIFHTYIRLKASVDPQAFEKKLNAAIDRRAGPDLKAFGVSRQLFLQPLTGIYLHSDLDDEIGTNGNATYLYILGSIALFVLLIACINFMNLSTARSGKRAKEVGVRKVMGAERRSLVFQFLGESILMSCLALLLAVGLTRLLLPLLSDLTQKDLQFLDEPAPWLSVAGLTLLTGFLAGLYPAFYLSSFRPVSVLKGRLLNNFSAVFIRKGLIVFQFTISIILVAGAIIIARQLNFLDNRDLGFNKSQQVILPLQSPVAAANYQALKNELVKDPAIRTVTSGSTYPGITSVNDLLFYAQGKTVHDVIDIQLAAVEDDYFQTLGLTLLEGSVFSRQFMADSGNIILNETALKELGYDRRTALGKIVNYDFQGQHHTMRIIGIVKDFNFESLYNSIKPFAFTTSIGNKYSYAIVNSSANDYSSLITRIERAWKKINPGTPFSYSFLDKDFQHNYEKDQRASAIVRYFTIVTILIACLGLFGLSVFSAEQRTREIGIRKVLGASVTNIALLLSRDFLGLVCVGILVATPVAWYAMTEWLQGFAYRVQIGWWLFPAAGVIAVLIAWITVSFQAIRAAVANPAKSLRTE